MQDKHYVVVGRSSGIGFALVKLISQAGRKVIVYSRTENLAGLTNVSHIPLDILFLKNLFQFYLFVLAK